MRGEVPEMGARIERLRKVLGEATDFGQIWALFDESLAVDDAFIRMGKCVKDRDMEHTVRTAVSHVLRNTGRPLEFEMIRIASHGFAHGFALFESAMCTFFHFKADDRGLIVAKRSLFDPQVHYLRFSLFEASRESFPVPSIKGPPQ